MTKDEAITHVIVLVITKQLLEHYPEFDRQQVREFTYGALRGLEEMLRLAHHIDMTGPPPDAVGIEASFRAK